MSLRRERAKVAFQASPENMGGAQLILEQYRHMQERLNDIRPSTIQLAAVKQYTHDLSRAERLSRNRAARRASHNQEASEHANNLYHMYRRIEELYTRSSRIKDPWDTTVHPAYLRRGTNPYQEMLKEEMEALRPATTTAAWSRNRHHRSAAPGDSYTGWSVREALGATYPRSRYEEALSQADRSIYKKAIMAEILDHRMYKEVDLRALFRSYLRLAPLGDKEAVAVVIRELKRELLVK